MYRRRTLRQEKAPQRFPDRRLQVDDEESRLTDNRLLIFFVCRHGRTGAYILTLMTRCRCCLRANVTRHYIVTDAQTHKAKSPRL